MEVNQRQPNHHLNNFINNVINDLKNLSNALRPLSRQSADTNNAIINKVLLGTDKESLQIIKAILAHLLHIVDLKGVNAYILSILTKVISLVKVVAEEQNERGEKLFDPQTFCQEMSSILYHLIDIIFLFKSKHKESQMTLRIIQSTFSLIDHELLQYANYHLMIRIYSICLECCLAHSIVQNISASALFALTQVVFSHGKADDCGNILQQFLEFVLNGKKFSWIRDQSLKGLIWDLTVIGIRNSPPGHLQQLTNHKAIPTLLQEMYKISLRKVFFAEQSKQGKTVSRPAKGEREKNHNPSKQSQQEFIRYYKTLIFLSIHLSIRMQGQQLVPYRDNIQLFKVLYEMDRSNKYYLLLEGVTLLLIEGSHLLIEDERSILLLDILSKVVEELCLSNLPLEITSEAKELHLEKMWADATQANDLDYIRLIRNSIIKLRKKFEGQIDAKVRTGELLMTEGTDVSERSESDLSERMGLGLRKKWEKIVNDVVQVIRYLTSLNMQESTNEQAVRKLILQLQYWYLICPSARTRNLILQELLTTSTYIDSKLQAIKVSQCVQIGSNIIYGYYESLDTVGLMTILKMMARVKTTWQDGKGFEELDEVCSMSEKLYLEQNLVTSDKSFSKTIQAFVQCLNGLVAQIQQSAKEAVPRKAGRNQNDRLMKMSEYIFDKLLIILDQNVGYIQREWNFLTGFWLSLCCCGSQQIKQKTMNHVASVTMILLKRTQIKQEVILSAYVELSKVQSKEICQLVLGHLKQILLILHSEQAIIQLFRIIRVMAEAQPSVDLGHQIYQLEEMVIKQALFRVTSAEHIVFVIESLSALNESKNEEYKTVNLIWTISDHVKALAKRGELKEKEWVWRQLFGKLYWLGLHSPHSETKQSCIHTFTQILAQSIQILGLQTFSVIVEEIYLELFYVLMNLNGSSPRISGGGLPEMVRVGVKNLTKVVKKCLLNEIVQTGDYLNQILEQMLKEFPQLPAQDTTIQYLFEVCTLLQFYKGFGTAGSETPITYNKEKVVLCINMIEKTHQRFDHSTVFWRKKYHPAFQELRSFFST